MATLISLPEELIDKVVINLRDTGDTETMTSLSRVSKQMHRIMEPHLYNEIIIMTLKSNFRNLIRTLNDRPNLRKHVKHFCTNRDLSHGTFDSMEAYRDAESFELLEIICQLLPEIKTLYMGYYCWRYELFHSLPSRCSSLESVDLHVYRNSISSLHALFALPCICKIVLRDVSIDDGFELREKYAKYWANLESPVQHLTLVDIYIVQEWGSQLLGDACKSLKSLELDDSPFGENAQEINLTLIDAFKKCIADGQFEYLQISFTDVPEFRISHRKPHGTYTAWISEIADTEQILISKEVAQGNSGLAFGLRNLTMDQQTPAHTRAEDSLWLSAVIVQSLADPMLVTLMLRGPVAPEVIRQVEIECETLQLEFSHQPW